MSRSRSWPRLLGVGFLGISLVVLSVGAYATWVEPYWIESTFHRITGPVQSPLKIAHVTDLHSSGLYRRERKVLDLVRASKPDIIFLTGDNINQLYDFDGVAKVLSQFRAPLGVWMVRGNWEKGVPLEDEKDEMETNEATFYQKAGVRLLINEVARPRSDFWVWGLDNLEASPEVIQRLDRESGPEFRIALFHSPMVFPHLADRIHLAFAGHTHGGQVRLPGLGVLSLPFGSGGFLSGWYTRADARLYVSRGVGNTVVDARLGCRPEVAFFEVIPSK